MQQDFFTIGDDVGDEEYGLCKDCCDKYKEFLKDDFIWTWFISSAGRDNRG